jgi:hypothetical protein
VIWAIGPVVNGAPIYHGKDAHDDSGTTQVHRSDECNPINWISGEPVCKMTEYCCPAAGACLTPTKTACKSGTDCGTGQACCPLTGVCVTPGKLSALASFFHSCRRVLHKKYIFMLDILHSSYHIPLTAQLTP